MNRTLRVFLLIAFLLFLSGCFGGGKTIPAWRLRALHARESYQQLSLEGKEDLAAVNYKKAMDALKTAGDVQMLRALILTQISLDILLDRETMPAEKSYEKWRSLDPSIAQDAFYDFLKTGKSNASLRKDYQVLLEFLEAENWTEFNRSLKSCNPFSAILTIKLASKDRALPESTLKVMREIAAEQGWKLVLINALDLSIAKAEKDNNLALSKSLRLRKELVCAPNQVILKVP